MIIKGFKKYNDRRRMHMVNKINKKTSIEELLIEEIENSSTNDWNELCDACSSLIDEAEMTDSDIDDIVMKVKNGAM
jgi:hypothetical protein